MDKSVHKILNGKHCWHYASVQDKETKVKLRCCECPAKRYVTEEKARILVESPKAGIA